MNVEQGVPAEYRQTDAGCIPSTWSAPPLHALVKSHNAGVYKRADLYGHGCNIIGVSDLYDIAAVGGQVFERVPLSAAEKAQYLLNDGDLLYGESSLVREGIARTVFVDERGANTAFAWHTRRYSVKRQAVVPAYLYYYLQSRFARQHMMDHAIQTAITGINTDAYFSCPIALPPLDEQRAIADALGDVDALLDALGRQIAKHRDLKQAAMQQLLTGRTRLPGFTGEWPELQLGEVASFGKGFGLPKSALIAGGTEPCIHYGELFTQYGVSISETISRTNAVATAVRSTANDVLMPTSDVTPRGLAKASCVLDDGVMLGGDILIIRADGERVDGTFLSCLIRYDADQVLKLVTGSTVYHLYAGDMRKFRLGLPSLAEQTAIAAVLSDMDAEISALEARRAKTGDLKQAMLQELLTGRTRLI